MKFENDLRVNLFKNLGLSWTNSEIQLEMECLVQNYGPRRQ